MSQHLSIKRNFELMDESGSSSASAGMQEGGAGPQMPPEWCPSPLRKRHKLIPLTSSSPDAHEAYASMLSSQQQQQQQQTMTSSAPSFAFQPSQQQHHFQLYQQTGDAASGSSSSSSSSSTSPKKRSLEYSSHFKAGISSHFDYDGLDRFLPPSKRRRQNQQPQHSFPMQFGQQFQQEQQQTSRASGHASPVYTEEQVRLIVQGAVRECEDRLSEMFGRILREKLTEQFENFSKFNEDYISRTLRDSEWSYMS